MTDIETIITEEIEAHEKAHEGLYSQSDLETLRPVWRKQLEQVALKSLANK